MNRQRILTLGASIVLLAASAHPALARGFGGGGGFHGGGGFGGGGFHGGGGFGGFSGGDRFGGGGFGGVGGGGGGGFDRSGGFGGGGFDRSGGGFGGGGFDRSNNFGGGFRGGDLGAAGGIGRDGAAGGFDRGNFGAAPTRQSLNGFLGLPSDDGFHGLGGGGSPFTVNHGSVEGPRGGVAAGTTVEGPRGNEAGRGVAVGPNGGVAAGRGVEGAGGGKAGQGVAVGPNGRVAGGSAVRGPNGYGGGRGFAAGPNGYAAGFSRVTPNARYATGAAVRTNFNHYGIYGHGWYTNHPGAWDAAGWAAGSAWTAATWASLGSWFDYGDAAPVDYDYGTNVTYDHDTVYVNNQPSGSADQWYQQAATLATTGAQADPSADADWMPLGVFALSQKGYDSSNVAIQLAVDKQGVIRGNYTDMFADQPQSIQGSVDKKTQKVAFTVGKNQTTVFETGLYNLTENEAPVLIHFGSDRTQQWLLVRLKQPADSTATPSTGANP